MPIEEFEKALLKLERATGLYYASSLGSRIADLKTRRLLLEKEQSKVTAAYADLYAEYHELVMGRE